MSAGAPPVSAAPAMGPKRRSVKSKKTGPAVSDLILKAASASEGRGCASLVAIKKSLVASGYDVSKNNSRILIAVRRLVAKGDLTRISGSGASGSFKINKKQPAAKRRSATTKPPVKRGNRSSPKKPTGRRKSMRKRRKSKSPRKAKRPNAAKKPKSPWEAERKPSTTRTSRATAASLEK